MRKNKVLNKLSKKSITPEIAYNYLYKPPKIKKAKKAKFIKLRFEIKESKATSNFLNILFFIPLPLGIINLFKNKIKNYNDIANLLIKGISIEVYSEEANILIKTL